MARNPTVAGEGLPARYGFSGGKNAEYAAFSPLRRQCKP